MVFTPLDQLPDDPNAAPKQTGHFTPLDQLPDAPALAKPTPQPTPNTPGVLARPKPVPALDPQPLQEWSGQGKSTSEIFNHLLEQDHPTHKNLEPDKAEVTQALKLIHEGHPLNAYHPPTWDEKLSGGLARGLAPAAQPLAIPIKLGRLMGLADKNPSYIEQLKLTAQQQNEDQSGQQGTWAQKLVAGALEQGIPIAAQAPAFIYASGLGLAQKAALLAKVGKISGPVTRWVVTQLAKIGIGAADMAAVQAAYMQNPVEGAKTGGKLAAAEIVAKATGSKTAQVLAGPALFATEATMNARNQGKSWKESLLEGGKTALGIAPFAVAGLVKPDAEAPKPTTPHEEQIIKDTNELVKQHGAATAKAEPQPTEQKGGTSTDGEKKPLPQEGREKGNAQGKKEGSEEVNFPGQPDQAQGAGGTPDSAPKAQADDPRTVYFKRGKADGDIYSTKARAAMFGDPVPVDPKTKQPLTGPVPESHPAWGWRESYDAYDPYDPASVKTPFDLAQDDFNKQKEQQQNESSEKGQQPQGNQPEHPDGDQGGQTPEAGGGNRPVNGPPEQGQAGGVKPANEAAARTFGISDASVDQTLKEMGQPPATQAAKTTFKQSMGEANEEYTKDPYAGQKLLDELDGHSRPLNGKEDSMLLIEMKRLQLAVWKTADDYNQAQQSGDDAAIRATKKAMDAAQLEYNRGAQIDQDVGHENAVGLGHRRQRIKEDNSLANLMRREMVTRGKMTPEEYDKAQAEVKELHGRLEQAEKDMAEKARSEADARQSQVVAEKLASDLKEHNERLQNQLKQAQAGRLGKGPIKGRPAAIRPYGGRLTPEEISKLKLAGARLQGKSEAAMDSLFPGEEVTPEPGYVPPKGKKTSGILGRSGKLSSFIKSLGGLDIKKDSPEYQEMRQALGGGKEADDQLSWLIKQDKFFGNKGRRPITLDMLRQHLEEVGMLPKGSTEMDAAHFVGHNLNDKMNTRTDEEPTYEEQIEYENARLTEENRRLKQGGKDWSKEGEGEETPNQTRSEDDDLPFDIQRTKAGDRAPKPYSQPKSVLPVNASPMEPDEIMNQFDRSVSQSQKMLLNQGANIARPETRAAVDQVVNRLAAEHGVHIHGVDVVPHIREFDLEKEEDLKYLKEAGFFKTDKELQDAKANGETFTAAGTCLFIDGGSKGPPRSYIRLADGANARTVWHEYGHALDQAGLAPKQWAGRSEAWARHVADLLSQGKDGEVKLNAELRAEEPGGMWAGYKADTEQDNGQPITERGPPQYDIKKNAPLSPEEETQKDRMDIGLLLLKGLGYDFDEWSSEVKKYTGFMTDAQLKELYRQSRAKLSSDVREKQLNRIKEKMTPKKGKAAKRWGDMSRQVDAIAKNLIEEGITEREPLINALHNELQQIDPNLTRQDVMDIYSNYGQYSRQSQEEVDVFNRDLKAQTREVRKHMDRRAGEPMKLTGKEADQPSDELRRLQQETAELKKGDYDKALEGKDRSRFIKSTLASMKTHQENSISDLADDLVNGTRRINGHEVPMTDDEYKANQAKLEVLRGIYRETFGHPEMTDEQRVKAALAAAKKSHAENEAMVATYAKSGDPADLRRPKSENRTPSTPELEAMMAKRDASRELVKHLRNLAEPKKTKAEIYNQSRLTWLTNRTAELADRTSRGEFDPKPKPDPIALTPAVQAAKAKYNEIRNEFEDRQFEHEMMNRSKMAKVLDGALDLYRAFLISGPKTIGKIFGTDVVDAADSTLQEAIGGFYSLIFNRYSRIADIEGGFSPQALGKEFDRGSAQGWKDLKDVALKGKSQDELLHGTHLKSRGELTGFVGRAHQVLRSFRMAQLRELAKTKMIESDKRNGVPLTEQRMNEINQIAHNYANDKAFLGKNRASTIISSIGRTIEGKKNPITGQFGPFNKIGATVWRWLTPLTRIGTNVVSKSMQRGFGVPVGLGRIAMDYHRGLETVTPERANETFGLLKSGTVGAILAAYVAAHFTDFGGFFRSDKKKKPGEVPYGRFSIGGHLMPQWMGYHPDILFMQAIATMYHYYHDETEPKFSIHPRRPGAVIKEPVGQKELIAESIFHGLASAASEAPFMRTISDVGSLLQMKPGAASRFGRQEIKGALIPQAVSQTAEIMDRDAEGNEIKRVPKTIGQALESGIPGVRKNVPEYKEQQSKRRKW